MHIIERPSPNHGPRREGPVDILLLHYTGMASAAAALDRLRDPAAAVSSHYVVDEDGTVYRLVDEARRAWHAGAAFWAGTHDVNSRSIGIELVNPGHEFGYPPFPPAQMAALAALAGGVLARHPIPRHRVLGHSDVAPGRKRDPGEKLDWAWLAAHWIGLWPSPDAAVPTIDPAAGLSRIGYAVDDLPAAITAFQRHWRPRLVDGLADDETRRRIAQIADLCPPPIDAEPPRA
ncbi:MAG TPA: N-acetylmuramoyl-L-alanine amidase [Stellaceae bacterium]|nr:N-acetylmuramoyl-L-alanine amidase [Stellaceae bacterium]